MSDPVWRTAGPGDVASLTELEQEANLVALGHVFPADRFPFPVDGVRDRWAATLADPHVRVEVVDGGAGLAAFLAYDAILLRHLGVRPTRWGAGLGRAGVERAVSEMRAMGSTQPRLWCLTESVRARGLYERLGWRLTGVEQTCPWPPYPIELEYAAPTEPYARES